MKKQYQNIKSQITNLKTNKHVDETTIISNCFNEKTYLDLINPYSDLISIGRDENNKHIYSDNIDFNEYLEYNKIDYAVCNRLHVLIGCFEKMMKNFLMHKYCEKMKASGDRQVKDYSWVDSYISGSATFDLVNINKVFSGGSLHNADSNLINRRKEVLKHIKKLNTTSSENNIVNHYQDSYHYVPMFVAIHSLTLGQLLSLFSMLKQDDKNELVCIFNGTSSKRYSDTQIEKFEKDAIRIQVIRNIVNHYEPIFPFIKNTETRTFSSLTDLLKKLVSFYKRTSSYYVEEFDVIKTYRSRNDYSFDFHLKIEKVIESLK